MESSLRPTTGSRARRSACAFLFLAALLTLATVYSCVDLSSVSRFAAISKVASEKFPEMAVDIETSCMRTSRYQSLDGAQYELGKIEAAALQTCDTSRGLDALEKDLIAANRTLMEYMDAMGRLASNKVATYDKNLDALAAGMVATKQFEEKRVNAVKGLVTFLSNTAADVWRKKQLAQVIGAANQDLQTVTEALKEIVGTDYMQLLDNEESAMKNYYFDTVKNAQDYYGKLIEQQFKNNPQDRPKALPEETVMLGYIHDKWERERAGVEARRTAAKAYVKIADRIGKMHQKLYDSRGELGAAEVKDMVLGYAKELDPLIRDLRKAF